MASLSNDAAYVDIFETRVRLQRLLSRAVAEPVSADEVAAVWSAVSALLANLADLQTRARPKTLAEARRIADLYDDLLDKSPDERIAAIVERTGRPRRTVYRLLKLSRCASESGTASSVPT